MRNKENIFQYALLSGGLGKSRHCQDLHQKQYPPNPKVSVSVWEEGGGGVNVLKFQKLFLFCSQKIVGYQGGPYT